jgi:hypothetical protein
MLLLWLDDPQLLRLPEVSAPPHTPFLPPTSCSHRLSPPLLPFSSCSLQMLQQLHLATVDTPPVPLPPCSPNPFANMKAIAKAFALPDAADAAAVQAAVRSRVAVWDL